MAAAKFMIDFYVCDYSGLTCDEQDPHSDYTYDEDFSLKSFQTSTTLGKSALILARYAGRAPETAVELVASIAQASDPVLEDVIRIIPYTDSSRFLTHVLAYESCMSSFTQEAFR